MSNPKNFWSNFYKVEVMATFLKEMLELSNFGHMTTSTIQFESHDKVFGHIMDKNYGAITSISKYLYFNKG